MVHLVAMYTPTPPMPMPAGGDCRPPLTPYTIAPAAEVRKNVRMKLPEWLHRELKARAALAGETLPGYLERVLEQMVGESAPR